MNWEYILLLPLQYYVVSFNTTSTNCAHAIGKVRHGITMRMLSGKSGMESLCACYRESQAWNHDVWPHQFEHHIHQLSHQFYQRYWIKSPNNPNCNSQMPNIVAELETCFKTYQKHTSKTNVQI
jgi:hypothetical protein